MRSLTCISLLLLLPSAFAFPGNGGDDAADGKGHPVKTSLILKPTSVSQPISTSKPTSTSISRPKATTEVQDGVTGTLITLPTQIADSGLKKIPDADHPYIAPGPNDQRGPCPAMNTLANHGYIPRNGVATFEQMTIAQMEAFNLERDFAANIAATNMMTRGNPFANKLSMGRESPLVPHIPFHLDGPGLPGGTGKHGRFEGDGSLSREDANLGNNKDFQDILFDRMLLQLGKFGGNGPNGNNTVLNVDVMTAIEKEIFAREQAANPKFEIPANRLNGISIQTSFVLNIFANGTNQQIDMLTFGSFFRNESFPPNWYRAPSPQFANVTGAVGAQVIAGLGQVPGRNNAQGVYVADPIPPAPFDTPLKCQSYWMQMAVTPGKYSNTTGIFKQNIDLLTDAQLRFNGCAHKILPFGPSGN
ncbi:hypothetical protein C8J56DRAFT_1159892 [Mycena floridula]|nr:hypothetical protein C8J56DRAFT_1159892 [Mycena floridula]